MWGAQWTRPMCYPPCRTHWRSITSAYVFPHSTVTVSIGQLTDADSRNLSRAASLSRARYNIFIILLVTIYINIYPVYILVPHPHLYFVVVADHIRFCRLLCLRRPFYVYISATLLIISLTHNSQRRRLGKKPEKSHRLDDSQRPADP